MFFFFKGALEKIVVFFSGCLKTDGFEFHNFEIIHYLIEQNERFDRAMTFLVRNNLVPNKKRSNWG